MIRLVLLLACSAVVLGGCGHRAATQPPLTPPPPASQFAPSRFDCDQDREPLPPNPDRSGADMDDISDYEDRLLEWGRRCGIKLKSVGRELGAKGQVAKPASAAKQKR